MSATKRFGGFGPSAVGAVFRLYPTPPAPTPGGIKLDGPNIAIAIVVEDSVTHEYSSPELPALRLHMGRLQVYGVAPPFELQSRPASWST